MRVVKVLICENCGSEYIVSNYRTGRRKYCVDCQVELMKKRIAESHRKKRLKEAVI